MRTELERLLKVFNQAYARVSDYKTLEIAELEIEGDKVLEMMINRLASSHTGRSTARIEIEEEVENVIEQHIRDKQELRERLEQEKYRRFSKRTGDFSKRRSFPKRNKEIEALKALLKNRQVIPIPTKLCNCFTPHKSKQTLPF